MLRTWRVFEGSKLVYPVCLGQVCALAAGAAGNSVAGSAGAGESARGQSSQGGMSQGGSAGAAAGAAGSGGAVAMTCDKPIANAQTWNDIKAAHTVPAWLKNGSWSYTAGIAGYRPAQANAKSSAGDVRGPSFSAAPRQRDRPCAFLAGAHAIMVTFSRS